MSIIMVPVLGSSEALVPQTLGGVVTDVDATGEIRANMYTARFRPAPGMLKRSQATTGNRQIPARQDRFCSLSVK